MRAQAVNACKCVLMMYVKPPKTVSKQVTSQLWADRATRNARSQARPAYRKACSARSIARPRAAALLTVSSYSLRGSESATSPAPACNHKSASQQTAFSLALSTPHTAWPFCFTSLLGAASRKAICGVPRQALQQHASAASSRCRATLALRVCYVTQAEQVRGSCQQIDDPLAPAAASVIIQAVRRACGDDHGAQRQSHVHAWRFETI